MFVFEEETEILRRENVVELATDGMHRIVRKILCRRGSWAYRDRTAVVCDLPLVVANHAELQQLA